MSQNINPVSSRLTKQPSYKRKGIYFLLVFTFIGFLLSVTQVMGESPDYSNYDTFIDLVRSDGIETIYTSRFEPGFTIIVFVLMTLFSSNLVVYSVSVAGVMFLKGLVINLFSSSRSIFFVVAVFYFARYYPLHELIQLRVACGMAFLLVAAVFLWRGNWLYGLLACVAAFFFHMSTVALIPTLFIKATKRWYVILIGLGVSFLLLNVVDFVYTYLSNFISIVYGDYKTFGIRFRLVSCEQRPLKSL